MKKNMMRVFLFLVMVFVSGVWMNSARAELTITPMRVVLGDKDRFATVTLVNTSQKTNTYTIGFRYQKMRESGSVYDTVDKSVTDFDLGKHLNFSPRRITLAPGAKQKVRLALRRPAEAIPPGDYRVHLEFSSVPDQNKKPNEIKTNEKRVGAVVDIYVGFSIPVILRVGEPSVTAGIEQISITRAASGAMQVVVPVTRGGGAYSILGHLFVYHIGADGKEEVVGEVSNAHVFSEVNRRVYNVVLNKEIRGGSLKVVMRNFDKNDPFVYAEKTFPMQ
jgi:fimbrial chaperone protein